MILLLLLFLVLYLPWFFAESILNQGGIVYWIGFSYLGVIGLSIILLVYFFRKIKTNYAFGTIVFAIWVSLTVPSLFFFVPGALYRFVFNQEWLLYLGWALAMLNLMAILYGVFFGRWNWKIHRVQPKFIGVPEALKNLKIIQLSDIHAGTFLKNKHKVDKAIEQINALEADYIFFTGDLVNNMAEEIDFWIPVFKKMRAKKGMYSILGNHDYGDYVPWRDPLDKSENFNKLLEAHRLIGFLPLMNQSLEIEKGIWLLGVENWGKAPFRQSGDLLKTLESVPQDAFKILLSHDPSHFDLEVVHKTNINLTLSGHTHGMQFGIERFGIRWSPVKLRYKKWAGLYKVNNQYLYVNRGFGVLGFPGRVGIYPEITLFTFNDE